MTLRAAPETAVGSWVDCPGPEHRLPAVGKYAEFNNGVRKTTTALLVNFMVSVGLSVLVNEVSGHGFVFPMIARFEHGQKLLF